jgi:iron complex outermembrane receptor protein
MRRFNLWLLLQLLVIAALGQHNLKGIVTGNGEPLSGASVIIVNSFYGTSSGSEGQFEFKNLKEGTYTLRASFIGYEPQDVSVQITADEEVEINLRPKTVMTEEVLISATRAKDKTPVAYTTITDDEIASRNMGQDIPYLLQLTPSFVATSDAGAGVGYTNFRIRGSDLNRVNVTVNGIPLNDAESHGTWFVDLPDLASSLENVQIQRGVGTSSNGAAAFGATINLQTNTMQKDAYAEYKTAGGSFNTFKNTVSAGTGLLNDHFTLNARLSKVTSDGFIDRASSDLKSFFVSGGYYSEKTVLKANVFSGWEETYQSWWGVPSVRLNNDVEGMRRYEEHWLYTPRQTEEMINSDSRTYNYYTFENQVDRYQQDHYQLHFSHKISPSINLNTSGFYIRGKGYYENFKPGEDLVDYQIPVINIGEETIETTDLVNRKWLDNHFYGFTFSLNYNKNRSDFTLGGGWNTYDGDHYGNVIWAQFVGEAGFNHEYYRNNGLKKDFNIFGKYNYQVAEKLNLFADLQYRRIDYSIDGIDDDLRDISQVHEFNFFNPKLGVFYEPAQNHDLYVSFATANREPNRTAYVDADPEGRQPVYETLYDWELGYKYNSTVFSGDVNIYYMNYKNQLVLTGEINDVGNPIMANVDKSYRAGIELQAGIIITKNFEWQGNVTFSQSKIKDFTEYVDNWDTGGQEAFELGTTDIAFSPNTVANSRLSYKPANNFSMSLTSSYVGKQYIDNTSSDKRSIDPYFVNNFKVDYSFSGKVFDEIKLHLMVNNLLNEMYESNAWVYSYIFGGERYEMDGYFPQAGRHFMVGVDFSF